MTTKTHDAEIEGAVLAPLIGGRLPENDEGIAAVTSLAKKAAGDFRAETLRAPAGAVGVPQELPVLILTGEAPEIRSLKGEFDKHRFAPERRAGRATVTTLASFIDLLNRHKDEHSAIFAATAWPCPKLTAVVDYHQTDGAARFGQHKIEYAFPLTDEFKAWIDQNGKSMEQADFAVFLEDHAAELAQATAEEKQIYGDLFKERVAEPIELVSLSRHLEVYVGAKVKRQERLQSGERSIIFDEQHTNAVGEPVDIPGVFMIQLPAFVDGSPLRMPARIRYRVAGGAVKWVYQLYRWEFWLREQVRADMLFAAEQTQLPAYEGAPEPTPPAP